MTAWTLLKLTKLCFLEADLPQLWQGCIEQKHLFYPSLLTVLLFLLLKRKQESVDCSGLLISYSPVTSYSRSLYSLTFSRKLNCKLSMLHDQKMFVQIIASLPSFGDCFLRLINNNLYCQELVLLPCLSSKPQVYIKIRVEVLLDC